MPRAMKDSGIKWIGFIPAEWTIIKIKHLCNKEKNSFQDGDWIESPFITNEGIRYLTTGNVGDGIFKRQGNGHISEDTFAELNCKYAYPNDLVISRLNAPYGRACILPSDEKEYVLAVDIVILRTDHDKRYLCYLMQCQGYQNTVQDEAKGTTMKRISRTNLGNIYLPIAPLDEQQRIADYLDGECARIDSIVEKTRASIVEYKKLKQAIITRAVTKGIRPNRLMKDSSIEWLGQIPADWELKKLKYISRFMQTKYSKQDGQLNYVGLENIVSWSGAFVKTDSAYDRDQSLICEAGDILFGKLRPYLAKVHLSASKQCCSSEFAVIRMADSQSKRFFCYQLLSHGFIFTVDSSTYGTKMPRANAEFIKNMSLVVPPLDEQKEIAAYLDEKTAAIDSLIAKKNQLMSELESLKKSLIFEYVTGKKEVI